MPIFNKINNEQRCTHDVSVKVNGQWHQASQYTKVDGEWKQIHSPKYTSNDIIGFRIVYERCNNFKKHPNFDNLPVNHDIPVRFDLTGDTTGLMSLHEKGVIFEYDRTYPDVEGVSMYEGRLLAVMSNKQVIDVCQSGSGEHRVTSNIPLTPEIWWSNKLNDINIEIEASISYESYGYYVAGWNSLFNIDQFLDQTNTSINKEDKNNYDINSYIILPIDNRVDSFDKVASIGIARDMHTQGLNMVGSHGNISQTIHWIKVDGEIKPFVIEIYR